VGLAAFMGGARRVPRSRGNGVSEKGRPAGTRPAVARAAFAVSNLLIRAARLAAYAGLGALRRSQLVDLIRHEWDEYGRSGWDWFAVLWDWEKDFYLKNLRAGDRVLLVGCGTGRDLVPLLEAGYAVDGLDLSPASIEICRGHLAHRGLSAPLLVGSVDEAPLSGPYDVVLFSWYAYGYLVGRSARVGALRRLAAHLAPGGRILFSYVLHEPKTSRVPTALARAVGALTGSDWRAEHGEMLTVGGGRRRPVIHFERRFEPHEVADEVAEAGLRLASHDHEDNGCVVLERSVVREEADAAPLQRAPNAARTASTALSSGRNASS
jgi:SAM-dependent methyltransferase